MEQYMMETFFTIIALGKNTAFQVQKDGYLFYSQNINLKRLHLTNKAV